MTRSRCGTSTPPRRMPPGEARARELVAARAGGRCEICRGPAPRTFSHRKPTSLGGLWAPSNGLRACGSGTTGCHGWIEANPVWAEFAGFRVRSVGDPAVEPVWVWPVLAWPGWVTLDDDGGYVYDDVQSPKPVHLPPQVPDAP